MKLPTDGDWIPIGVMCGVLMVCAGGWATHAHAQPPEISEIPVQRIEEIGTLTKFVLTLRTIMAPAVRDQIGSLYAYDPTVPELDGLEVHPETIGDVAIVSQCSGDSEEPRWCARYFDHMDNSEALLAAYQAAYRATAAGRPNGTGETGPNSQSSNQPPTYFATTYPLPNVEPAQQFVSGLSP